MNIGLTAHDAKKMLMENFCIAYQGILSKHNIFATGGTGSIIEQACGIKVHKYLPGHMGGAQQMGSQIEYNEIDMVIFLRDPYSTRINEPDIDIIGKICDTYNIPVATNLAAAELMILALDRGDLNWREMYK